MNIFIGIILIVCGIVTICVETKNSPSREQFNKLVDNVTILAESQNRLLKMESEKPRVFYATDSKTLKELKP